MFKRCFSIPRNTPCPPFSMLGCPYITNGLTSYTFYATGETRSMTSHITFNTKNVIYMVQCNRCNLRYIGETKRRLATSQGEI